eukprot:86339-Rhodomonas_salina.3
MCIRDRCLSCCLASRCAVTKHTMRLQVVTLFTYALVWRLPVLSPRAHAARPSRLTEAGRVLCALSLSARAPESARPRARPALRPAWLALQPGVPCPPHWRAVAPLSWGQTPI